MHLHGAGDFKSFLKRKLDAHRELVEGTIGRGREKQSYKKHRVQLVFDDSANKCYP